MITIVKINNPSYYSYIIYIQGVLDRLSNIEDIASVGWIQVDQRPAKHALTALAEKWKHIYASHLERQVHN